MKKLTQRLRLKTETVRVLNAQELPRIEGGYAPTWCPHSELNETCSSQTHTSVIQPV